MTFCPTKLKNLNKIVWSQKLKKKKKRWHR